MYNTWRPTPMILKYATNKQPLRTNAKMNRLLALLQLLLLGRVKQS